MLIPTSEYQLRRRALMAAMRPDSIAIVASAHELIRNRDTHYPFRQSSDFYYLTGFAEPDAVLALIPGREQGEVVVFCRERDAARELWDGKRAGLEGVVEHYGADDAFPIDDIDEILPGLLESRDCVYYSLGRNQDFDLQVMAWVNDLRKRARMGASPPEEFVDLDHLLHELRLVKSEAELTVMRKAGAISGVAHQRAMQVCRPGMWEYQLEAELNHEFAMAGARFSAYPAIIGGGVNGCILHYIDNDTVLQDGDLVLIDAGCEYQCYASDITRTFPVNGRFSEPQKRVYEWVLKAQEAAIACIAPGRSWDDSHRAAVRVLCEGLIDIGVLNGDVDTLIADGAYQKYYMHRTGHWLGLDVHDVGDYRVDAEWRPLCEGMVLTVEPGLYLAPDDENVPQAYRGIAIRIEDDVCVTAEGCEVLTPHAPKQVADIEALMACTK